jgi:peptidyl-tRNA hydrolase, PTH2 family
MARKSSPNEKFMTVINPILIGVLSFTLGYTLRPLLRSISTTSRKSKSKSPDNATPHSSDSDIDADSDAEDEALAVSSDISKISATTFDEVKLVLVVNDELKMSKGKIAAQAGHATLACALTLKEVNPRV